MDDGDDRGNPDLKLGRRDVVALGVLTLAALALRLWELGRFELWVDEAATWHFARLTAAGRLLEQIALEPTPPLYYGLVGVLMRLFGESDFVMRLPSALAGAAAVPAVFVLAHRFFGRRAGAWAAVLIAVHPLHVFYSREARVYPLLLVESVLLWIVLEKALRDDRRRSWAAFGAVLLIACYSHFYGLFLGATAGVLILWRAPSRRARLHGLLAAGLAGLLFAPYLVATLPHLRTSGAAWSVEMFYDKLPEEKRFGRTLEMGLLGAGYHPFLRQISVPPTPPVLRWLALLVQAALLALAVLRMRRTDRAGALGFLLAAWILPLLIPWTINHWRGVYHTGRHDFYVIGTLMVLLGVGLAELSRRRGATARLALGLAVLVLGLAAGHRLFHLHRLPAASTNRATGAWIARHASAGDRVMAMGIRRLVSEHYARLGGSEVPFESFPPSTDAHPGWSDVRALLEDEVALEREARARLVALEQELDPGATLYVLVRSYPRTASAVSAEWLVDRHVLKNLSAGWRPAGDLANRELGIAAFRRRAPQGGS